MKQEVYPPDCDVQYPNEVSNSNISICLYPLKGDKYHTVSLVDISLNMDNLISQISLNTMNAYYLLCYYKHKL
jgi:hypothetical protein